MRQKKRSEFDAMNDLSKNARRSKKESKRIHKSYDREWDDEWEGEDESGWFNDYRDNFKIHENAGE